MANRSWTTAQIQRLEEEYALHPNLRQLADELKKTYEALKSKATVLKLTRVTYGTNGWTPANIEKLIELYPHTRNRDIAKEIDMPESSIATKALKLKLKKDPACKREWSKDGMFKKGNSPVNKGKKQSEYMSPEAIEKTKATRFKKGQPNHNSQYDGAINIRYDHIHRGGRPIKYIRLSRGVWRELHIVEWEKVNGPVPEKHVLSCVDGDTLNVDPSNWQLITMAENMKRNSSSINLPDSYVAYLLAGKKFRDLKQELLKFPELIEIKRAQLQLNRTINEQRKNANTEASGKASK